MDDLFSLLPPPCNVGPVKAPSAPYRDGMDSHVCFMGTGQPRAQKKLRVWIVDEDKQVTEEETMPSGNICMTETASTPLSSNTFRVPLVNQETGAMFTHPTVPLNIRAPGSLEATGSVSNQVVISSAEPEPLVAVEHATPSPVIHELHKKEHKLADPDDDSQSRSDEESTPNHIQSSTHTALEEDYFGDPDEPLIARKVFVCEHGEFNDVGTCARSGSILTVHVNLQNSDTCTLLLVGKNENTGINLPDKVMVVYRDSSTPPLVGRMETLRGDGEACLMLDEAILKALVYPVHIAGTILVL